MEVEFSIAGLRESNREVGRPDRGGGRGGGEADEQDQGGDDNNDHHNSGESGGGSAGDGKSITMCYALLDSSISYITKI